MAKRNKTRVVWVYYPPQVLIIDWFLEIRHKGSRLKVPFAVTRHILSYAKNQVMGLNPAGDASRCVLEQNTLGLHCSQPLTLQRSVKWKAVLTAFHFKRILQILICWQDLLISSRLNEAELILMNANSARVLVKPYHFLFQIFPLFYVFEKFETRPIVVVQICSDMSVPQSVISNNYISRFLLTGCKALTGLNTVPLWLLGYCKSEYLWGYYEGPLKKKKKTEIRTKPVKWYIWVCLTLNNKSNSKIYVIRDRTIFMPGKMDEFGGKHKIIFLWKGGSNFFPQYWKREHEIHIQETDDLRRTTKFFLCFARGTHLCCCCWKYMKLLHPPNQTHFSTHIFASRFQGFFFRGGLGVPHLAKILSIPHPTLVPVFGPKLVPPPPPRFIPKNLKTLNTFLCQLWLFLSSKVP